jgi:signal peptidase I
MYFEDEKKLGLSKYGKILIIFAGILIGFLISRIFFITPFVVQDDSMMPGLKKGDYLLILKITSPRPGDIILLDSPVEPDKVILKRFLAESGISLEIKNKRIYVNSNEYIPGWHIQSNDNRVFPESFDHRDNMPVLKIKPGEIFVIGDNFDYSFDSRSFGGVNKKLIIGKMIYKF